MTEKKTISRRTLVKSGLGALAAPAVLRVLPAQRGIERHQGRPCQPEDRPARRLRRGRQFHPRAGARPPEEGARRVGGKTYQVEIISKDSQSNASRASEVASDLILGDKVDLIIASADARHHQSGRRPGRSQRGALRHHQLPVAALFLRPQGRSQEGLHLDLSFLLGPGGRHRLLPGAVGLAADQQGGRRPVPQRRRRQCLGRSASSACRRRSPRPATSCTIPAATS